MSIRSFPCLAARPKRCDERGRRKTRGESLTNEGEVGTKKQKRNEMGEREKVGSGISDNFAAG